MIQRKNGSNTSRLYKTLRLTKPTSPTAPPPCSPGHDENYEDDADVGVGDDDDGGGDSDPPI